MKPIDLFIFDLDGTLIDSKEDIAAAVNATLRHFDKPTLSSDTIASHVGHGIKNLFEKTVNQHGGLENGVTVKEAFNYLLDYYFDHCAEFSTLYPGVEKTLEHLQQQDKKLAICTNKPERHTRRTLELMNLKRFFTTVICGDTLSERKPHPLVMETILKQEDSFPETTLMVGDSFLDVKAGKNNGIMTCGCSYGLEPLADLEAAEPDHIIDRFDQLLELFE